MDNAQTKIDWLKIASAAGMHGVRYRTNRALLDFIAEVAPLARHRLERSEPVGWMYERRQTGEGVTAEFFSRRRWVLHSEAYTETPLYTTPPEPVAEIERLRKALKRLSDERTLQTTIPEGPWTPEMVAEFQSKEVGHMRDLARTALGDAA